MANDPPILVTDEPTGNLDSKTAETVFRLFERLVGQGKTILMVTHDQDLARRVTRTVFLADGEIIDEYLARALPVLTEEQLLRATHQLDPFSFPPDALIIYEGQQVSNFYIITKGRVEVLLRPPNGQEVVVVTMGVGQYFGEIELLRGNTSIATIRAGSDTGVEVVALERREFAELIEGSERAREAISRVAEERAAENLAARQLEEKMPHA
jgi:CRP-like cAMP-binding protein